VLRKPASPCRSKARSQDENIDETLMFYRLPRQHHKRLKSTNMLERLNEEIKRQTHVVPIFADSESCLRPVRALAVETHENWLGQHGYLNVGGAITRSRAGREAPTQASSPTVQW
jgi:transposase-like protein